MLRATNIVIKRGNSLVTSARTNTHHASTSFHFARRSPFSKTLIYFKNYATRTNTQNPSTQSPQQASSNEQAHTDNQAEMPTIIELNYTNFAPFVMQSQVPVIIDCYADWCEPCKQLTPKLVQHVQQAGGALRLGLLNVDNNPELAKELKIENLPTTIGLFEGKIVEGFTGMRKDDQLKSFIDGLLKVGGSKNSIKYIQEAERLLKSLDVDGAAQIYSHLLQQTNLKSEAIALAGLARCALAVNDVSGATEIVNQLKASFPKELENPEVKKALVALELANQESPVGEELQALIDKVEKNPEDLQAKYDLATSYMTSGKYQAALDQCFAIMRKNKNWQDGASKKLVMKIFDVLGPKDEMVREARKKLTNLLFV